MIKKLTIFLVVIFLIAVGIFVFPKNENKTENIPEKKVEISDQKDEVKSADDQKNTKDISEISNTNKDEDEKVIPDKILIDVPFTSQAPFGKWDEFHEEACEEASLVMLKYFLEKKELNPEVAEKEIQSLIKFQIKNDGDYKDSDVERVVKLYNDFYGKADDKVKLSVVYDFTKEDLKKYLAQGNLIIIPAAGRLLKNPNFTSPGPLYHNLVLVGYDGNDIITNDPGTKRGQGYKYNIDTLFNAIHDFPGKKEDIEKGPTAMIVLK